MRNWCVPTDNVIFVFVFNKVNNFDHVNIVDSSRSIGPPTHLKCKSQT